ncbi:hypothetical protein C8T65DRAFT_727571 [Cerioporus squamosus]|nr:hypothetical protein C8T65DRAFT_727571 [Cerioporus squamosus]
MDAARTDPIPIGTRTVELGEPPEDPTDVVTSPNIASTSADPPRNEGHPPCNCWENPKEKRNAQGFKAVPLNLALPPIRTELTRAVRAINSIITLVQEKVAVDLEDRGTSPPPEVLDDFSSQRESVANCFETASLLITTTPGYACKQGSAEHEQRYFQRHKELTDVEDMLTRTLEAAEPLLKARDKLVLEERRYRLRKYIQTVFRVVSIATIPYSPLLSAILTAADVFGISVDMAIQQLELPDADELGATMRNAMVLEKSIKEIRRSVEELKQIKEHLEVVKAKLDEVQQRPIATHLAGILYKVYLAKQAVAGALSPSSDECACSSSAVPIRDVVAALRDMAEALEAPQVITGPLASLSEDDTACVVIDRALEVLRTSSPASEPAGSD